MLTNIKGDIYGGITAAVVALPLALAFGVSSGAGPIAGLYGAICVGLFASLLGGTSAQISGPTGPMTVVMAAIFTQYTAADPQSGPIIAFTIVIMGGAIQILFGLLRIGRYIALVPIPVVSGFMSGIGVIIILLQLGPLLGHAPSASPINALKSVTDIVTNPLMGPAILGLLGMVIVFFMPKNWNKIFPSPLVALIVGTLCYLIFLQDYDVPILGEIPSGLPSLQMPVIHWELFSSMLISAATLALLGSIDSLLTSLVADNITRTHHHSDKELIGQGVGNMVAGVLGGLPGAGATMRTVINVKAGGRTPLSGVVHAIILLAIVLGASGFAEKIPHAVLAAILIKVGFDIIDWDYFSQLMNAPKPGVMIMIIVLLITVFIDLIVAVGTGMIIASFVLMQRMAKLQMEAAQLSRSGDETKYFNSEEKQILDDAKGKIVVYQLSGALSFPAAKDMVKRISYVDHYDTLILDMTNVSHVDYTSSRAIKDIIENECEDHHEIFLSGASSLVLDTLRTQKALNNIPEHHIFNQRLDALKGARKTE
ncbi:MAG: SulP family inorganic anion transporter [Gammaproteobacteria bacterium]